MSLTISDKAAERVLSFGSKMLRVAVEQSGCTGMSYKVTVGDDIVDSDYIYESNGITIVVDSHSIPYIDGTHIDYDTDLLNGGFRYNNPNVSNACGCGISFTTGE